MNDGVLSIIFLEQEDIFMKLSHCLFCPVYYSISITEIHLFLTIIYSVSRGIIEVDLYSIEED